MKKKKKNPQAPLQDVEAPQVPVEAEGKKGNQRLIVWICLDASCKDAGGVTRRVVLKISSIKKISEGTCETRRVFVEVRPSAPSLDVTQSSLTQGTLQRHVDEQHPPPGEEPGGRRKGKRSSSQAVDRDPDDEGVEGGRYECDRPGCTKAYATKEKLRKHVRNHEVVDEGRTICSTCKKSFSSRSVKRRHQASAGHVQTPSPPREPKPFQCPYFQCDRSYARQNTLNEHLKSHEGKADCPYCSKSYGRPEGMHEHVRKKHPDKPDPRDKHNPN
ncbi:uncharacterized protein [Bemisia tabaci]|uniref:uncharacterized protein n=1 Tax=Bemisia tabaci TaxID=7038 RepID=UPI003B28B3FE